MTEPVAAHPLGVVVTVHVQPGARRLGVAGLHGDAVRFRVTAPPVDGRANAEVLDEVARCFGVRRADVELLAPTTNRRKRVLLRGVDLDDARAQLDALLRP